MLRNPWDWAEAVFRHTSYDPIRKVVELGGAGLEASPVLEVVAKDGTIYRSDPEHDVVLRKGTCDAAFAPWFGGHGAMTGRLRRPLGLALDDAGHLYVADADNHRVQVVRLVDCSVVIVLGCADAWGEPVPGSSNGAMTEPVGIAVSERAIYVADRGAHVLHVFDRAFRWQRSFTAAPQPVPSGFVASPIALGLTADGALVVADAGWPRLLRFACDGTQLADLAYSDPALPASLVTLANAARFAASGDVVVGPIDGGVEDLAWHRVIIDAELPPGTHVEVQTFASDEKQPPPQPPPPWPLPIPWAPAAPIAMPDPLADRKGELQRPVLSDVGRWQRRRHGDYLRARPIIAEYAGDGPNGVATLMLGGAGLRSVRSGDVVELTSTTPPAQERVTIGVIAPRTVRFAARGDMVVFAAGTSIVLRQRDGREPFAGPRTLYELAAGEVIDLSTVLADGTLFERTAPHAVASLLHRGDVVDLVSATHRATIVVDDVPADPIAVPLVAAPSANFSDSVARLVDTPGRLFVRDITGIDALTPPDEPIAVFGITPQSAPWSVPAAIHWVEPELGAVWLAPGSAVVFEHWEGFTTPEAKATDRGRYLWLRLRLAGAVVHADDDLAFATPTIRAVRLVRPRLSYLRYLPALYSRRDAGDPTGALFAERMLAMFEHELTRVEARYESVAHQVDPWAADPEWLRFVATWFDLYLDPSLSPAQQRTLLAEVHSLYAKRGTPDGIRRYIEIVTGHVPTLVEGQQVRPSSRIVLGCTGVVGCSALGGADENEARGVAFLDRYAHRLTIYAFVLDRCRREEVEALLRRILPTIVPAHVAVTLHVVPPDARVGEQSMVGIDLVLGDHRIEPHVLGETMRIGDRPHPVLGLDPVLYGNRHSFTADDVGARIDHGLLLE